MNQEITPETQALKTNLVEDKGLDKYESGDSFTDRLGNIEGYGEDTLKNMLENYCRNVLGYTEAQIEPLLADFSRQFSIHNGQKWLDFDPDAKSPYEYAHNNQWRLIEAQNGYFALEKDDGSGGGYRSFRWKIKARSNPAGMSNSDLWAQDYRFMRSLRGWGYKVDEDGDVLENNDEKQRKSGRMRGLAKRLLIYGALIGFASFSFSQAEKQEQRTPKTPLSLEQMENEGTELNGVRYGIESAYSRNEEYKVFMLRLDLNQMGLIEVDNPEITIRYFSKSNGANIGTSVLSMRQIYDALQANSANGGLAVAVLTDRINTSLLREAGYFVEQPILVENQQPEDISIEITASSGGSNILRDIGNGEIITVTSRDVTGRFTIDDAGQMIQEADLASPHG